MWKIQGALILPGKVRPYFVFVLLCFCLLLQGLYAQRLQLSENRRFLVTENGKPFFWQADTAWELFHRCSREEAAFYLNKRASQGFNVIQAVALAELDGLNTPNAYGHTPLHSNRPETPNEAYFEHVDHIIKKADSLDMYIALLPSWGDKVFKDRWGMGPEIFTAQSAYSFGLWMGKRYRLQDNIIWIVGGDRNPRDTTADVSIWRAMAEGIQQGTEGEALMSFHPQPQPLGGSSTWFHKDAWLDFNMHQTGHCADRGTYKNIAHDYQLDPIKPVLDGEPLYEDHPNCFNAAELGYSLPEDIRRIMYWNVFAGAFGQTYGCHDVWQMYSRGREPVNGPLRPWQQALDLPMANQMKHLKNLMLSRPFLSRIPDPALIPMAQEEDDSFVIGTRDLEGLYAMVYFPTGKPADIDMSKLQGGLIQLWWYDPRTGHAWDAGTHPKSDRLTITPPSSGKGQDWVLVADAEGKSFQPPGKEMNP